MNIKKLLGYLFELPALILLVGSFIGGIYATINKIQGITFITPLILGIICLLYFIGMFLLHQGYNDE